MHTHLHRAWSTVGNAILEFPVGWILHSAPHFGSLVDRLHGIHDTEFSECCFGWLSNIHCKLHFGSPRIALTWYKSVNYELVLVKYILHGTPHLGGLVDRLYMTQECVSYDCWKLLQCIIHIILHDTRVCALINMTSTELLTALTKFLMQMPRVWPPAIAVKFYSHPKFEAREGLQCELPLRKESNSEMQANPMLEPKGQAHALKPTWKQIQCLHSHVQGYTVLKPFARRDSLIIG